MKTACAIIEVQSQKRSSSGLNIASRQSVWTNLCRNSYWVTKPLGKY